MKQPTRALDSARPVSPPQSRPVLIGAALLLLMVFASSCGGGSSKATPSPIPSASAATAAASTGDQPARRDLAELARRLRGIESPARAVQLPPLHVGDVQSFDLVLLPADPNAPARRHTISATVRAVSDHAYFAFEDGTSVADDEVQAAVQVFESTIWPKVTGAFGLPAIPGVDGDPRIVVLHANLGDAVGGYENEEDKYPRSVVPHSNQREMIYINLGIRPLGSDGYTHTVAHELQHLIHVAGGGSNEVWINEGLSEVAGNLASKQPPFYKSFLERPDTQLNAWTQISDSAPHYGGSALFFEYLLAQTGGNPGRLAREPGFGTDSVRAFLRDSGSSRTFEQVVADWAVANLLAEGQGPYGYGGKDVGKASTQAVTAFGAQQGTVHQFAAEYLELDAGTLAGARTLTFQGDTQVPVLAGQPSPGGAFWWSGRGDDIDSMLTREFDLGKVSTATLTFRTWYDIERRYDYGYVEASRDGGATWRALPGLLTTTDDPLGVSYGPGYTGLSGGGSAAAWVDERIDLSAYAGSKVLVRFELINDDSTSDVGWAIDDINVPEIGFSDHADGNVGGWQRQGFRRISGELPQRFILRLVTMGPAPQVRDIKLDGQNRATVDLSGLRKDGQKAVLVILGETDSTSEVAHYRYDIEPAPQGGT